MQLSLNQFNALPETEAVSSLITCCTSQNWAQQVASNRPFDSLSSLLSVSDSIWQQMQEEDYLQAFEGHPQIGDVSTLSKKYQNTAESAASEQSAVNNADKKTVEALAAANKAYLDKFGFIFIVFASDKSATQMLNLITERLSNTRQQELINGAVEQNKITRHRLQSLIGTSPTQITNL